MLYLSSLYLDSISARGGTTSEVNGDKPEESEKKLPPLPNDKDVHDPSVSVVAIEKRPVAEAGLSLRLPQRLWPSPS